MWKKYFDRVTDSSVDADLSRFESQRRAVLAACERLKPLSDHELKNLKPSDRCSIFALAAEAAARSLGMRPFPVQLLAALALAEGNIVELQTGEGKTLVATMPAIEHGLSGRGCHVLTSNDYLAQRDARWMAPVYLFLGLSVGYVQKTSSWVERQQAYRCDVTYATATEAGFDYLRTQLCTDVASRLHTTLTHVIVDEADSILIDEARVPLVIAGPSAATDQDRQRIEKLVDALRDEFWEIDAYGRNVVLTDAGASWVEAQLQCGSLYASANRLLLTQINQALHAHHLVSRDIDYIVRADKIELVDECTGRVALDRRWPDGLQGAIEAKEGVPIREDGRMLGTITLQNFVGIYEHISGMTATACEDADELYRTYGTKVVPIPANQPCLRIDHPDLVFTHKAAKWQAIVEEIVGHHQIGRPVLVGTANIGESELLAQEIRKRGYSCHVLNAANDAAEAAIIAEAGSLAAITISTNMAGRGTDIKLGGLDETHRQQLVQLGGLHVVGTNRFESRRIDRQLRGRAGRQGDPGSSRFIVGLEDDLMLRFRLRDSVPAEQYPARSLEPLHDRLILRAVEHLQRRVSGQNAEIRNTLWQYNQLLEMQRKSTELWRNDILAGAVSCVGDCQNFEALIDQYGPDVLAKTERELLLEHVDEGWAEHLATVADIREGAHLTVKVTDIGGLDPYLSYRAQIDAAYSLFRINVIEWVIADLERNDVDRSARTIGGPAGTWTYLINDQFFDDFRQSMFDHTANGTASYAVLITWPFLLIWALWVKISRRS